MGMDRFGPVFNAVAGDPRRTEARCLDRSLRPKHFRISACTYSAFAEKIVKNSFTGAVAYNENSPARNSPRVFLYVASGRILWRATSNATARVKFSR